MKVKKIAISGLLCFLGLISNAQDSAKISVQWRNLHKGLDFCEIDAPLKSIVNDSKISIVKINPEKFEFHLLTSSEHDSTQTAVEWADNFKMNVVINAGMYDLSKKLINKGYMQNYKHLNNPNFNPSYGAMIAFNPSEKKIPNFKIIDLNCEPWDSIKPYYNSYSQGMRMLDCNGKPLTWNKKNQSCSMLLAAADEEGNIYYIFSRSPYTHNQMIQFLLALPFKLVNAVYLEGGPETSLYIHIGDTKIEKIGSYISNSYPNDKNDHFWKLPNVIGLKVK
ncbi:MAG: phosphodiester glycosidase family protein [Bacteroidetes bacterium]|nr:phosphodiester glycosidase family protein [Bacteroidota bacterium]